MPEIKDMRTIKINDVKFTPVEGVNYRHDYVKMYDFVAENSKKDPRIELSVWKKVILNDLFFILYFVMGIEAANHPFVVDACQEVEDGPESMTLDVWAREHYKSTIITVGETLQYHLRNPEATTGIFAYARPLAKSFLRAIKVLCETSALLKACFPDVLYEKPETQAPKWSEDDGLIFKRKSGARRESTIEAWGLVEGMPTGRHFNRRVYDDIETQDIADNPEQLNKCFSKFEMSDNLGMEGGVERVIGTFYSHAGPIVKIQEKKDLEGDTMYTTRIKAATHDATVGGRPVLLSQERLNKLKMSGHFNSQQLCDPTPVGERKLSGECLIDIEPTDIPDNIHKLMLVDPAGDNDTSKVADNDPWGMMVVGVEPDLDDLGASNLYITDLVIERLGETEGTEEAVRMYLRNGVIFQLGVEKVALSTTEIHIANALKVHRRRVSREDGTLYVLTPAGRNKQRRITSALSWPLFNGKLHISTAIPQKYRDTIRQEMDFFPFGGHEEGCDMLAYAYDMIHDKDNKYRLLSSPRRKKHLELVPRPASEVSGLGWLGA